MAKYILTAQRAKKNVRPMAKTSTPEEWRASLKKDDSLYLPDIPAPTKNTVVYFDCHKDAPKGFALRVTPAGSKAWILNYYIKGRERRLTLDKSYPAWGPKKARIEASKIKTAINSGTSDPLAEKAELNLAEIAAKAAKSAKSEHTLGKLLEAYVEQLKRKGKASARAVDNCVKKNVELAFPKLWNKPAEDIDLDDCVDIVAGLADQDKMREAAKLRSYLRAAYTAAISARGDASAGPALRKFKLKSNPAAALATIAGNVQARNRVLSLPELRLYWQRITALPSPDGSVLAFHLLTGAQRLEQLFRLTDKDRDDNTVTLHDPKGRRKIPRVHVVPLLPEAITALDDIGDGPFLVSFDGGKTPSTDSQFRSRVKTLSAAMLEAKEITEPFTPGDLRRTVETRLTAAGVTSDTLKHLLSHGFGGVQDRHYQRYEFQPEKLNALVTLRDLLTTPSGDVVPMKRRANK